MPDIDARTRERAGDGWVTALFATTAFLASGLLFAVEPMVARMLLPRLGGSPAVWTTALVFFQAALLVGYGLAHVLARRLPPRLHPPVQLALLVAAGATLPVALPDGWVPPAGGNPVGWTLAALTLAVGAPFVALSTANPTLQRWLATTDHPGRHDPAYLYAAGNVGSLVALLAYPLLVEPALGLGAQRRVWAGAYAVLVVCTAACVAVTRARPAPVDGASADDRDRGGPARAAPADGASRATWRWIGLAIVPAALLAGVTRFLATDIASVPLLWVVPLSIYLLSFVAAFGGHAARVARVGTAATLVLAVPVLWSAVEGLGARAGGIGQVWEAGVHLAGFAAVACAAHGRLAHLRPAARDLTGYYLALSFGGVLGGVAAAIVAPLVFDGVHEYPLAFAAGFLTLGPGAAWPSTRTLLRWAAALVAVWGALAVAGGAAARLGLLLLAGGAAAPLMRRAPRVTAVVLVAAIAWRAGVSEHEVLRAERTFFGVLRVEVIDDLHVLWSGSTIHGMQRAPDDREPLAYFSRQGPLGQAYAALAGDGRLDVGVVGLGAGTLAAYGRPGDRFTFYEIDDAVVRAARDPRLFTYLSGAPRGVDIDIRVGDGRLLLDRATGTRHDLLVLDAFSSDAIPVHLLTREAFRVYRDRLAAGGVLAVHVSNRFFDLAPQVAALGADAGLAVRLNRFPGGDVRSGDGLAAPADWLVLAADESRLDGIAARGDWRVPEPAGEVWTDDHADLLAALRW